MRNLAHAFSDPRLVRKFFLLVGAIVVSFMLVATTGVLAFLRARADTGNPFPGPDTPPPNTAAPAVVPPAEQTDAPRVTGGETAQGTEAPAETPAPVNTTTFLIVGEHNVSPITDVIFVACLNRDTGELNILSIPRDTRIELPTDTIQTMRGLGLHPPASGVLKINAINSYGGQKYGIQLLEQEIYDLIGVRVDYYADIDLAGFRKIVDDIGGVDMTIPKGGFYYSDPGQNLYIAIPAGPQHLDGKMAEGVVRFREFPNGDIGRIETQHEFMRQFFAQLLQKDVLIKNAVNFITTIIGYVKTDFGLTDIPGFMPVLGKLDAGGVSFYTLPGEGRYIGDVSYYIPDYSQFQDTVGKLLFTDAGGGDR